MGPANTRAMLRKRAEELVAELEDVNTALIALGEQAVRPKRSRRTRAPKQAEPTRLSTDGSETKDQDANSVSGMAAKILDAMPNDGSTTTLNEVMANLGFEPDKRSSVAASLSYLKNRKHLIDGVGKGKYRLRLTED